LTEQVVIHIVKERTICLVRRAFVLQAAEVGLCCSRHEPGLPQHNQVENFTFLQSGFRRIISIESGEFFMTGKPLSVVLPLCLVFLFSTVFVYAEDLKTVQLPQPQTDGGKPLMQVLKERKTTREFSDQKLSPQVLSNLLWAACGISRPDGKRTAPSARNKQEIDVYVTTPDGLFLYDAKTHSLKTILTKDVREQTGKQNTAKEAAVNLVYVADFSRMQEGDDKVALSWADTGFIAENAYLFCASEGLGVVVRALIDKDELGKTLKLTPDQKITLAQSIGYPKAK
jgi:SagB-type dehydrogenase family enzyme